MQNLKTPKERFFQASPYHYVYVHITLHACVQRKIGKLAAEKRGLEWALTNFIKKACGATKGEIEEIEREQKE
jgi:hypothetical protein